MTVLERFDYVFGSFLTHTLPVKTHCEIPFRLLPVVTVILASKEDEAIAKCLRGILSRPMGSTDYDCGNLPPLEVACIIYRFSQA